MAFLDRFRITFKMRTIALRVYPVPWDLDSLLQRNSRISSSSSVMSLPFLVCDLILTRCLSTLLTSSRRHCSRFIFRQGQDHYLVLYSLYAWSTYTFRHFATIFYRERLCLWRFDYCYDTNRHVRHTSLLSLLLSLTSHKRNRRHQI
jgi:hypothetical protein